MKQVVSVSLGSTRRDVDQVVDLLGERVHLERRGTQGDLAAARELIAELDGKVDAIGLGGIDLDLYLGRRRYRFRDAKRLARAAKRTPVVCGAGLKNSLERFVVTWLADEIDWSATRVLMVSAVDRYGMAAELAERGATVLYGDFLFALGLPVPVYRLTTLRRLSGILLPVITRLPFRWVYPIGGEQESHKVRPGLSRYYQWADVIAGDWHYIRRYAPPSLAGKTVLTNTTTREDIAFLKDRGVKTLITTTPRFEGRSVGTNLLEAAFVAISGSYPLEAEHYEELISRAGLAPTRLELGDNIP